MHINEDIIDKKIISIDDMKRIELSILKEIKHFCEENNLTYFLLGGTLLGAVRHGGFIPWDDDIDIGMPRKDYEKFINIFQSEQCTLFKPGDKQYNYPFCKVSLNDTLVYELESCKKPIFGVYVDVFPLDFIPNEKKQQIKILRKIERWKIFLSVKNTKILKGKRLMRNLGVFFGKILLTPVPLAWLCKKFDKFISNCTRSSKYMGNFVWGYGSREITESKVFDESIKIKFEEDEFNVPKYYDVWLTNVFGDYMTLPPEDKRVSNHNMRAFYIIKNHEKEVDA